MFESWPFTNFHDLNLDWIVRTIETLSAEWVEYKTAWNNFTDHAYKDQITEILEDHPEWVTTVMDGAISYEKLNSTIQCFVTPEMYGAIGDGVTDDSVAIQTAVNTGQAVIFRGSYKINTSIEIEQPTHLFGAAGNNIILDEDVDGFKFINTSNITMDGINFTGADIFSEFYNMVEILNCDSITIEHCTFTDPQSDGIIISGNTPDDPYYNSNITIEHCVFKGHGHGRNGVSVTCGDNIKINKCSFDNVTSSGMPGAIDIEPNPYNMFYATHISITDCYFAESYYNDANVNIVKLAAAGEVSDIIISNCTFDNQQTDAVRIVGDADVTVEGCTFDSGTKSSIIKGGAGTVTVTGCIIKGALYLENGYMVMTGSEHIPQAVGITCINGSFIASNNKIEKSASQYCTGSPTGVLTSNILGGDTSTPWFTTGSNMTINNNIGTAADLGYISNDPAQLRLFTNTARDATFNNFKMFRANLTVNGTAKNNALIISYSPSSTIYTEIAIHFSGIYMRATNNDTWRQISA